MSLWNVFRELAGGKMYALACVLLAVLLFHHVGTLYQKQGRMREQLNTAVQINLNALRVLDDVKTLRNASEQAILYRDGLNHEEDKKRAAERISVPLYQNWHTAPVHPDALRLLRERSAGRNTSGENNAAAGIAAGNTRAGDHGRNERRTAGFRAGFALKPDPRQQPVQGTATLGEQGE